jgi:hypothetical protein
MLLPPANGSIEPTRKASSSPVNPPNVLVNTKKKTYMMDTRTSGGSKMGGKMSGNMSDMKSMCKSEAESMGAHMMGGSSMKKSK